MTAAGQGKGINALFNHRGLRKAARKLRVPFGLVVLVFIVSHAQRRWFVTGCIVSLLGGVLQLWCFASLKTRKILATRGLYAIVRNPMYLARFFLILGALMYTGAPWVIGLFVPLYGLYMVNRVAREEKLLEEVFGDPYREYCSRIHRFVPFFRGVRPADLRCFNREYFLRNHGQWNVLALVLFHALCFFVVFVWRGGRG